MGTEEEWTFKQVDFTDLSLAQAVVLVAKHHELDEFTPLGSGVFVASGLIMTAKHVIHEAWRTLGQHSERGLLAPFNIRAYHWPDQAGEIAEWTGRAFTRRHILISLS